MEGKGKREEKGRKGGRKGRKREGERQRGKKGGKQKPCRLQCSKLHL